MRRKTLARDQGQHLMLFGTTDRVSEPVPRGAPDPHSGMEIPRPTGVAPAPEDGRSAPREAVTLPEDEKADPGERPAGAPGGTTHRTTATVRLADLTVGPVRSRDLAALVASVRAVGMIEPVRVYRIGEEWHVTDGRRRCAAARLLCWDDVPAVIDDAADEASAALRAACTNRVRTRARPWEDLVAIDEIDQAPGRRVTGRVISMALGISESTVSEYRRMACVLDRALLDRAGVDTIRDEAALASLKRRELRSLMDAAADQEAVAARLHLLVHGERPSWAAAAEPEESVDWDAVIGKALRATDLARIRMALGELPAVHRAEFRRRFWESVDDA